MKTIFLSLFFFVVAIVSAEAESVKAESFILRGKVKNASKLSLAVSHPVSNEGFDIDIPENGQFERKLPIVGCGDVYLYLYQTITCMVFPGDTIDIAYDAAAQSFVLSGTTPARTRELNLDLLLSRKLKGTLAEAKDFYYGLYIQHGGQFPHTDTLLNRAKDVLDDYWNTVDDYELQQGELPRKKHFIARSLYEMAIVFAGDPFVYDALFSWGEGHMPEDLPDELFYYGDRFNPFFHNQVREFYLQAIRSWCWKSVWDLSPARMMKVAQAMIPDRELFETFCMNTLYQEGYVMHTSLKRLDAEWLVGQIHNSYYQQELKRMLQELSQFLQAGDVAPDFAFKDSRGKKVSLHDFKGKYVYLDFWNTGCAACIEEFPYLNRLVEDNPDLKDKLVIVSICAGYNEALWKNLIQKHRPAGLCLYADGEMIASYQISGFPHYMLIGPDGKIVSPSFYRPSQVVAHRAKDKNYLEVLIGYALSEMQEEAQESR